MGLKTAVRELFKPERRAGEGYTDRLIQEALLGASSSTAAQADKTAAVEFGVGLLGRCFATAIMEPDILNTALGASMREQMARRLMLTGNVVFAIDVGRNGAIRLQPAQTFDIRGGVQESSWLYHLLLPAPSRPEVQRMMSDGVVHIRIGADEHTPWKGSSPLLNAGLTAQMLARIELRGSQEANARSGYLLTVPDNTSDDTIDSMKTEIQSLDGGLAFAETTSGGYGQGQHASPQVDYKKVRLGAEFPEGNTSMRQTVGANIVAALGINSLMYAGGDAGTLREGYRQLLTSTLQPLALIMASELEKKLEFDQVKFNFSRLAAADIASRARAYGTLLSVPENDAMTHELALRLAGLDE